MGLNEAALLAALFFAAAVLYASVGHAGGSAYLAAMALVGVAPTIMRPTALSLNILVATLVVTRFARAGFVVPRRILPFIIGSLPFAFIGGSLTLPNEIYRPLVGITLILAAIRFGASAGRTDDEHPPHAPLPLAIAAGAAIGLLAGLTGTGGGIFLTPLIVLAGWSGMRHAAGTSSVFILANSISGLAGNFASVGSLPAAMPMWLAVVAVGALIGGELGTRRLNLSGLRRALAIVLVIAGLKLIFLG